MEKGEVVRGVGGGGLLPYMGYIGMSIDNYYMILYSSATPKHVKRGILCYHRFAKKGAMYKQSQEQQC